MSTRKQQATLASLILRGFDESCVTEEDDYVRVRCSQCEALVINGIACHETGCPNIQRDVEEEDDE